MEQLDENAFARHESPMAGETSGKALAMYTLTSLTCASIT